MIRPIHTQGLIIRHSSHHATINMRKLTHIHAGGLSVLAVYQALHKFYCQMYFRERVKENCYLLSTMGLQNLTDALFSRHYSLYCTYRALGCLSTTILQLMQNPPTGKQTLIGPAMFSTRLVRMPFKNFKRTESSLARELVQHV